MAEIFHPPLIQARNWQEAQRKFNEAMQQLARQFNNIYTGANIPAGRMNVSELDDISADVGTLTGGTINNTLVVNSLWRKIEDYTSTANGTTITIDSLDGDTDGEWILQIMAKWVSASAGSIRVTFNNDTGNNYGYEYGGTTAGAAIDGNSEGTDHWYLSSFTAANEVSWGRMRIYAKSGWERLGFTQINNESDGTGVGEILNLGSIWSNTADNITEIDLTSTIALAIGTGSRVMMYKRVA